jgi:hypothetical protein
MRFWRGNRVDGLFTMGRRAIAAQFWASPEAATVLAGHFPLERALRAYLTNPDGFNAVWAEPDFPALFDEVRRWWPPAGD